MIKRIISIFIIILYIINFNNSTIYANNVKKNPESLNISADSSILMDMNTGTILYSKNENKRHYPASITKILTTLIALEYNKPKDIITFSEEAVFGIDRSSSNLAMDVDEQITMKDALYSIMLMSANEVSAAVAEHIAGSVDNFANIMNQRAKQAGTINSNFKNPHGLHDSQHYTTAYDMAMIAKEAYEIPEFRKIISTITYQIQPTNKQPEIRYLANQHYMIKNTAYHYEGCTGGKTGFTDEAQSTLVTFAEQDNLKLVCVVLEEKGNQKYEDTIKLFDYGFNNFKAETLSVLDYPSSLDVYSDSENLLGSVDIYCEQKTIDTVIDKNISSSDIKEVINLPKRLIMPLEANSIIGSIDYYYNNELICKTNLKNLQEFKDIPVTKIIDNENIKVKHKNTPLFLIIIPILIIALFAYIIIYRKLKRRRGLYFRRRW